MAILPATQNQIPDNSIRDHFNKQTYLGNKFSIAETIMATGSQTPNILIQNSSSNTKAIFVTDFVITNTANNEIISYCYFNPTVTVLGTVINPVNLRPQSPTASIASVYMNPTVSANGTLVDVYDWGSIGPIGGRIDVFRLAILDPGQSFLLSTVATAIHPFYLDIGWYEL